MGNKTERQIFLQVIKEFENTKFSEGNNATEFWYFAYLKYLEDSTFGFNEDSSFRVRKKLKYN